MEPNEKFKDDPANISVKEDLLTDTTFDPCYFSWDTPFKLLIHSHHVSNLRLVQKLLVSISYRIKWLVQ